MKQLTNTRIFIVDDDPICQELYRKYLINIGITDIHLFDNGQECINALTDQPDIIILDYMMEPIDGITILKKIKRFNPDIYLVFISGQSEVQIAVNALKYGAFDYIIKGDDNEKDLVSVIQKILEIRALLERKDKDNGSKWTNLLSFFSL